MPPSIEKGLQNLSVNSPSLFVVLIISMAFGYSTYMQGVNFTTYLDNKEKRDLAAKEETLVLQKQRIDECHAVQTDSNDLMKRVAEKLSLQEQALIRLIDRMDRKTP